MAGVSQDDLIDLTQSPASSPIELDSQESDSSDMPEAIIELDSPIKTVRSANVGGSFTKRALFKDGGRGWNGNTRLPIYESPKERISTEKAVKIMLDEEFDEAMLCQMQPTCVDKNCLFVIDLDKLRDPKDISCDDMGSWRANGTHPSYVVVDKKGIITAISGKTAKKGKSSGRQYKLIKRYFFHKTSTDLQKTIFLLQDYSENLMSRAIVQYHFTGAEHAILTRPHGNSKKSSPYVRTMPSTFEDLTSVASKLTPKPTVNLVSTQVGGIISASSAGSLPRNERQVKDLRRKMKTSLKDPLSSVMLMCKESMKDFVRAVTGAPDYMVILSFDRTLDNLVRFCTDASLPIVLIFDPTFNLGQFEVTVTTYKHPLLVFRSPKEHSSEHPNLIGPVLIHQRKQFSNYHYFTSAIVGLRPQLHKLTAFGTDGEVALAQACQSQFPTAVHLRCWLHFKENLQHKLERDLRLPKQLAQEFIADVLGNVSSLEKGLVDADSEDIFDAQLASLKDVWNEREHQFTKNDPVFFDWFEKNSSEVVKKTMLKSIRQSAGLGVPPSPFYTNAVESINSLLKLRSNHKKLDLVTFITKLREIISSQFTEADRALAGLGDYKVADSYHKFQYDAALWCSLSEIQRKRVQTQFMSTKPIAIVSNAHEDIFSEETEVAETQYSPNPLTCLNINKYVADTIWKKATDLESDNCVVKAPGKSTQSWVVAKSSCSTTKPYFVSVNKGHYECESDCIHYHSCKVCAHIVAVAKLNKDLDKFITWHKQQQHEVNLTDLAESGLPKSSVGKKRAARKGISKKKSAKISKMVAKVSESSWKPREALTAYSTVPQQPPSAPTLMSGYQLEQVSNIPSVSYPYSPLPTTPSPAATNRYDATQQQSNPFLVTFITGNISICFGCKQHYRKPAVPPYNLCVMHREWRTFTIAGSPVPQSRFGNAYYHLHAICIRSMWPQFDPLTDLVIPEDIAVSLLSSHKDVIYATFGLRL